MKTIGLSWILLCVGLASCEPPSSSPEVGSESHFLTACNASCAEGFECLCGVCTEVCSDSATCSAIYADSTCVDVATRPASSRCDDTPVEAFCDVTCESNADCVGLGAGFACTGGFCRQGAASVPQGEPIEVDAVCDMYVADVCRAKLECFDWDYASYDACLAAQECDGFASLNDLLARGSVQYDAAAVGACHARLQQDPCSLAPILFSVPTLPEALAMCDALTGQLGAGATCDSSVECSEGLTCDLEAACPGTCVVPPPNDDLPEGSACLTEICIPAQEHCSQCALGLECVDEVCVKKPAVGDACSTILGCGADLWCDMAAGQCALKAAVGEPCSDFRQVAANCENGLWCDDPPARPMETGVCHEPAQQGQPCRDDTNCVEPLACHPAPGGTSVDLGTCGAKLPNGSLCNSFADCESDLCDANLCAPPPGLGEACTSTCAEGLTCSGSVCASKGYAGDPCGEAVTCVNSRCIDGTCTLRGHFGDACAVTDDCLSKSCDGVCIDPVGCAM